MVVLINFIFSLIIATRNSQWITVSEPALPRACWEMAVGSYNNTIFILGGRYPSWQQLVQYDTNNGVFLDHGQSVLSDHISPISFVSGYSQFYTQIGPQLFMIISGEFDSLSVYDMATNTYTSTWYDVVIPTSDSACLASSADYLFVMGGLNLDNSDYINKIQLLELSTKQWITNSLTMLTKRGSLSCIVYDQQLYAIGGDTGIQYLNSIERINILSQYSEYIDSLTAPAARTTPVIYNNMIWVIGGEYLNGSSFKTSGTFFYYDTVHIIDPKSTNVSLSPNRLPYVVDGVSAVTTNNVVYAFGGFNATTYEFLDSWMKYTALPVATCSVKYTVFPATTLSITNAYNGYDIYNDPSDMEMCLFSKSQVGASTKLSENFKVSEFTSHDGADGFRLSPTLIECLEGMRNYIGSSINLTIISGYRTITQNDNINGSKTSKHLSGTAADLYSVEGVIALANASICICRDLFKSQGNDIGLGIGATKFHVDMRKSFGTWVYGGSPFTKEQWPQYITSISCNNFKTTSTSTFTTTSTSTFTSSAVIAKTIGLANKHRNQYYVTYVTACFSVCVLFFLC